jgi:uncharacterized iron-regulated membrane protein
MPSKALLLRLHRWLTFVFALPLAVVVVTGLILSFEPVTETGRPSVPLTADRLIGLITQNDPAGTAQGLAIRGRDDTLILSVPGKSTEIDLKTGAVKPADQSSGLSALYRAARPIHERLIYDQGWIVIASTGALLVISGMGLLMGWPRLRNTLGGWHSTAAWVVLPLVILSPLTGLMMVMGLGGSMPPAPGARVPLVDVVRQVADQHEVADLVAIRGRGGRVMARVVEGTMVINYAVTPSGLRAIPTNWPRALHEGNWNVVAGPLANVVVSVVFLGLIGTGFVIWGRRTWRLRRIRRERLAAA